MSRMFIPFIDVGNVDLAGLIIMAAGQNGCSRHIVDLTLVFEMPSTLISISADRLTPSNHENGEYRPVWAMKPEGGPTYAMSWIHLAIARGGWHLRHGHAIK